MLHAVIMAGGSGTRFWPQSRTEVPKQLLPLVGSETMIQATVSRCQPTVPNDRVWVVTNHQQLAGTKSQLASLPDHSFLAEPCARNTAPCIGLAAIHLLNKDPEAVMLVMPADHVIETSEQFMKTAALAESMIEKDSEKLILLGVPPTYPSTGFGYIERGDSLDDAGYQVASFREKPDKETAQKFIDQGSFYWNCGIFIWKASRILEWIEKFEAETFARLQTIAQTIGTDDYQNTLEEEFPKMNSISIDHAILENADNIAVLDVPFSWDDLGSWQSLHRLLGEDENGNTLEGQHIGIDINGCIVRNTEESHLVATMGLENCIVVHTPDATLVASKDDENAIKKLVDKIRELGYERFL